MKNKKADIRTTWQLAREYLVPYVTLTKLGELKGVSSRVISSILWNGIAENILSTTISEAIYAKVVNSTHLNFQKRTNYWNKAFEKRAEVRNKISKNLTNLRKLEQILEYHISHYDEYASKATSPLTKELLNLRLTSVKESISKHCAALR